jgi:hypothetical protein
MFKTLSEERQSHFFSWFHLEPEGEPSLVDLHASQIFRPSGAAFQKLVRLEVIAGEGDKIVSAELWLDRRFIEGRQSAFARDIAKSFLEWSLEGDKSELKSTLIANIGNMRAANEPVITRADAIKPVPLDPSSGYGVFLGYRSSVTLELANATVSLKQVVLDNRAQNPWMDKTVQVVSPEHAARWLSMKVVESQK